MNHPLRCQCGTLKGHVSLAGHINRAVCYCKDCQAFARYLGKDNEVLDAMGGTDIVQTQPAHVVFTEGKEALACIRLTDKGLLRWYARCCNTPIGNTASDFKLSFVGLIHNCLETSGKPLEESFGPVRMYVSTKSTKSAKGTPPSSPLRTTAAIFGIFAMIARARINGSYKRTPFFDAERGAPVAAPKVLSPEELARARHPA
ncbi:MAG TPA: DUF6151 family protein [Noviherbaspirillum sp.]|nr:DUF6151 family protein [Noviherbaspirillum sp.]